LGGRNHPESMAAFARNRWPEWPGIRILSHTLGIDDTVRFDSLLVKDEFPTFRPPKELAVSTPPPDKNRIITGRVTEPSPVLKEPVAPKGISKLLPGAKARYERALQDAKAEYATAQERYSKAMEEVEAVYIAELNDWKKFEIDRKRKLSETKASYDKEKAAFEAKVRQRYEEVQELEREYRAGEAAAIIAYNSMVLDRSEYSDGFPQEFRLAYVQESKQLVIDYELPPPAIVPATSEYRYNKAKDTIEEKPRKTNESKDLYQDIVASVALRTLHEVLEADQQGNLEVAVFNGFVTIVEPATGKDTRSCLLSVRATKEKFQELDLARVDKKACLRNLGAQVSPHPYETQAVKPIVEFDMVDKRFVQAGDMIADLETKPNLMDLNPFEFENLVTNLFQQMGLETKLTRSSRDGGVDAVAFDTRPVIGGKVVIQAKRYKDTVGVSAVRDLYGTMMNEGANKGILVATSGYGPDAFEFAKDKPIELLDGGALLYLLDQIGVKARIILPQE